MRIIACALIMLGVVSGLGYFTLTHENNEEIARLERELGGLRAQNAEIARQNATLEAQVVALRDDPRLAERRARESAGLVKPHELIFQFEQPREAMAVEVALEVGPQLIRLAGQPVALGQLDAELRALIARVPGAMLRVRLDAALDPLARQRVVDVIDATALASRTLYLTPAQD